MRKNTHRTIALALAAIITIGASALPLSASGAEKTEAYQYSVSEASHYESDALEGVSKTRATDLDRLVRKYKYIRSVNNKSVYAYLRPTVTLGSSTASVRGLVIDGTAYLPFRAVANLVGASYTYDSAARTSVMRMAGLEVSASSGSYVVYANGRALFSDMPTVIMSDGRMYVCATSLAKALGLTLTVSEGRLALSGRVTPIASAASFYRENEVFWLARIIHAESSGEPLLGKIAVGNVVLNRVASREYPNTIYGVIFDRKYGVQFSPILNGSIYNQPSYASRLAAMICLEGFDTSDGALFFLRPELSTSSWIPKTRKYAFTVGNHDFYY